MLTRYQGITQWLGMSLLISLWLPIPTLAQVQSIPTNHAQKQTTAIRVSPGRATAIQFRNGEKIRFVLLSDTSRLVYTPNAPVESGQAQALYLRRIQPLSIPGATRTKIPNLFITTVDTQGQQYHYEFEVELVATAQADTQITITQAQYSLRDNVLDTYKGKATLLDIERGLKVAIAQRRISKNHPLVPAIQQCLLAAYNNTPLAEAAEQTKVPLSLLQDLGALGLQQLHQESAP